MKLGDLVTAVSSLTVVATLLDFVFLAVFVPVDPISGVDVASILSILSTSFLVGYMFAAKIQEESRMRV